MTECNLPKFSWIYFSPNSIQHSVLKAKSLEEELEEAKNNLNLLEEKGQKMLCQNKQLVGALLRLCCTISNINCSKDLRGPVCHGSWHWELFLMITTLLLLSSVWFKAGSVLPEVYMLHITFFKNHWGRRLCSDAHTKELFFQNLQWALGIISTWAGSNSKGPMDICLFWTDSQNPGSILVCLSNSMRHPRESIWIAC